MRIGQLITSFLPEMTNPTMTSTIFNLYAAPATVENKTGYSSASHGAVPATNSRGYGVLSGRGGVWRGVNDLLPFNLRPIKARRRIIKGWGGGMALELHSMRMRWHSHGKYQVRDATNSLKFWKKIGKK